MHWTLLHMPGLTAARSGGTSGGQDDLEQLVRTAACNWMCCKPCHVQLFASAKGAAEIDTMQAVQAALMLCPSRRHPDFISTLPVVTEEAGASEQVLLSLSSSLSVCREENAQFQSRHWEGI